MIVVIHERIKSPVLFIYCRTCCGRTWKCLIMNAKLKLWSKFWFQHQQYFYTRIWFIKPTNENNGFWNWVKKIDVWNTIYNLSLGQTLHLYTIFGKTSVVHLKTHCDSRRVNEWILMFWILMFCLCG